MAEDSLENSVRTRTASFPLLANAERSINAVSGDLEAGFKAVSNGVAILESFNCHFRPSEVLYFEDKLKIPLHRRGGA